MAELFAVITPGLESIACLELEHLGFGPFQVETGGIRFEGELDEIYGCNLHSRTINRLLIRFGRFHAAAFSELRKKASRLIWENYINPDIPVKIRSTSHQSRLYHSDAIIERVHGAIEDHLGFPIKLGTSNANDQSPIQLILVRFFNNICTISLDTSGAPLYKRGYRIDTAKAPLRETHAAAMLLASGWDTSQPLIDPFCGSGTIPIEAALMAAGIAPGINRKFSFMGWPGFDGIKWAQMLMQAKSSILIFPQIIQGSDRDQGAISASKTNAERAGVSDLIRFECKALSSLIAPPGVGLVITNPPFGLRLSSNKDIRNLYAQFGHVLREHCLKWQVTLLAPNNQLISQTGFGLDASINFINGGVQVILGMGIVS